MHCSILDFTLKGNCLGKKSSLPLDGILFSTTSDTQQVSKLLSFGFFLVVISKFFGSTLVQELFWFCFLWFLIPCVFFLGVLQVVKLVWILFLVVSACRTLVDLIDQIMCVIHDHLGVCEIKLLFTDVLEYTY